MIARQGKYQRPPHQLLALVRLAEAIQGREVTSESVTLAYIDQG
jgi:hypothetical protein